MSTVRGSRTRSVHSTRLRALAASLTGGVRLVAGASEPAARAYAEELARNGVGIILVGPAHSALDDVASSLTHSYGVEAVVAQAPFPLDRAACRPIREALRGKDVGFLVNCVGQPVSSQNLLETAEQHLLEQVNATVGLALLLVRLVLPGMLERSRGAVVNISPGACCRPRPARVALTACAVSWAQHRCPAGTGPPRGGG